MKVKSASGITCYVKNLGRTARFYKTLGFIIKAGDARHVAAYLNWYWIDFLAAAGEKRSAYRKQAAREDKAGAVFMHLSVDDVDAFHKWLGSKGIKPAGRPEDTAWGTREFLLHDPDGYNLVIFRRR